MRFFRLFLLLLLAGSAAPAAAYSVLTHQSLIDSTWTDCLLPLLRQRYPGATPAQWDEAKSYAYGGAILQDMGYYPLGASLFTNLTHYVRSGDFVRNLLGGARGRNEYAFALGALSHYAADNVGHPEATNLILPNVYPARRAQLGPVITYEQAPINHTEVEFAFDVGAIAAGRYRSHDYHKAIGFQLSKPLLERAFRQTYGLELGQVFLNVEASVVFFRLAVNHGLPLVARAAWLSQRRQLDEASPRVRYRDSLHRASRPAFRRVFGADSEWPGLGAGLLASLLNLMPKNGALRTYAFRVPSAADGVRFRRSYQQALLRYAALVREQPADTTAAPAGLPNTNLDTGRPTYPTDYILADVTYDQLLRELRKHNFEHLTPALQQHIMAFFAAGPPPAAPPARYTKATEQANKNTRKNRRQRREAQQALTELQGLTL